MIRNAATLPSPTEGAVVVSNQVPPGFKGSVMCRVIGQKFGPSASSGKPTISLVCEILLPEKHLCDLDGKTYDLTSLPVKVYLPFSDTDKNGKPTDSHAYYINNLFPKLGLPVEYDDENPLKSDSNPNGLQFEALLLEIYLQSKERKEQREVVRDGKKVYEEVKDLRGNTISRGYEWNMIDKKDILGLGDIAATVASNNRPV